METTTALAYQNDDKPDLCQQHCHKQCNIPTILVPQGRFAPMPQRWSCRQSFLAGPYSRGGVCMSDGFSPARTRRTTSVVALVPADTEAIGPPTISPVKKESSNVKIGAFATAASSVSARCPSCTSPRAIRV